MDPPPSCLLGHFPSLMDIQKSVREEVDMEAVGFVHFEDPQAAELRPSTFQEGQIVIPTLASHLDIQLLLVSEGPEVESSHRGESFRGHLKGDMGLFHAFCGVVSINTRLRGAVGAVQLRCIRIPHAPLDSD